jgi:hypothetical protein
MNMEASPGIWDAIMGKERSVAAYSIEPLVPRFSLQSHTFLPVSNDPYMEIML